MIRYYVEKSHDSDKLRIRFDADLEDQEFRESCRTTFASLGYEIFFDGNYFHMNHPDKNSPHSKIYIESDQWGIVWGEADPWRDVSENHELIRFMQELLNASGLFTADEVRQPRSS